MWRPILCVLYILIGESKTSFHYDHSLYQQDPKPKTQNMKLSWFTELLMVTATLSQ